MHVAANALAEILLHLDEIRGLSGAESVAARVHEVDQDQLAAQQVVIETHLFAFVSRQREIRQLTPRAAPAAGRENAASTAAGADPSRFRNSLFSMAASFRPTMSQRSIIA